MMKFRIVDVPLPGNLGRRRSFSRLALGSLAAPIAALSLVAPALADVQPATALGWECRNSDVEISCDSEGCEVADGHTPMSISVSAAELSVCAYSGCWEGAPSASMQAGRFLTVSGAVPPFSMNEDDRADISVTIDTVSGVGTLQVSGRYAHPVLCKARDQR